MPGYSLVVYCSLCLFVIAGSGCSRGIEAKSQGDVSTSATPPHNQKKEAAPVRDDIENHPRKPDRPPQSLHPPGNPDGAALGAGWEPISAESLKSHVVHLISCLRTHVQETGEDTLDLSAVLQFSFQLAQKRSGQSSATRENRLALLALGVVVGNSRIAWIVGYFPDASTNREIERLGMRVRLRGRRDLAQHFCVSAAMAALSNQTLSNSIGQMKERFDAGAGGSGFSFIDLLADQAGSRFGENACRSDQSAERWQHHLMRTPRTADYMPSPEGLPEKLSLERLNTEYGGIDGAGFRLMQKEIQKRLNRCSLLRNVNSARKWKEPSR